MSVYIEREIGGRDRETEREGQRERREVEVKLI